MAMNRKWRVLVISWATRLPMMFVTFALGRYLVEFEKAFPGTSRVYMDWTVSLPIIVSFLSFGAVLVYLRSTGYCITVITGAIIKCIGLVLTSVSVNHLQLIPSLGVLSGLGQSFIDGGTIFAVIDYFPIEDPFHVFATSIIYSTSNIGSLVGPLIADCMLGALNWRYCLLLLSISIMCFEMLHGVTEFKYIDTVLKDTQNTKKNSTGDHATSSLKLEIGLWTVAWLLKSMAVYFPHFLMVDHAVNLNLTKHQGSICTSILGATETVGRLFMCFGGDYFLKGRLLVFFTACCFALAAISLAGHYCVSFTSLALYSALYGLAAGPILAGSIATGAEITQGKFVKETCSITTYAFAIGITLGQTLTGFLFDIRGSYIDLFYLHTGLYLLAVVVCLIIIYITSANRTEL